MASSAHDPIMSRPPSGIVSPPRPMRSRTQSISSDRPSVFAHSLMSPPLTVSPEAAFIAASAASQIVTNDHDSHADTWYDHHGIEPAGETALVSPAALLLVNNFLDQLLFNFLLISRATTLTSLRPAVSEVLKPKLAKDAINNADEELREYLGGGDEDDFIQPHGADPSRDWDLELVWKRIRLRCMVYSSLGDMEEEDEDYYMEQENLDVGVDEQSPEVLSPAVAIFLTSILEFMGEQALVVAGQAAYHRMRSKLEKELKEGTRSQADIADRIVVEELDMERVALDRTLGRLWRAWKKRIRSPGGDGYSQRPFSRGSTSSHFRQGSNVTSDHPMPRRPSEFDTERGEHEPAEDELDEDARAASIPLPITNRDVDEIEVPGLAVYSDDEDEEEEVNDYDLPLRPKSLMIIPFTLHTDLPTPTMSQPHTPLLQPRKRSNSLPTPAVSPFMSTIVKLSEDECLEESNEQDAEGAALEEAAAEDKPRSPQSQLSQIITSASAIGGAVITGLAAVAHGTAPQTDASEDEIEEFTEEPEILTSSRVSVGGRSSPALSETGRPLSISSGRLQRSSSVHSARLVDVHGPKSPTVRSQTPSLDAAERPRQIIVPRTVSASPSPVLETHRLPNPVDTGMRGTASNLVARSPVERGAWQGRQNPSHPIAEAEEDAEALSARADTTPTTGTLSTPTSATIPPEQLQSQIKSSQHIFGSAVRQPHPPSSPRQEQTQSSTRVTILSSPFVDPPEVPYKSPPHSRAQRSGADKHVNGNTTHSSATSIGLVSVERPDSRSPDHEQDDHVTPIATSGITPRQIHTSGSSGSSGTNRLKAVRTSEESGSNRAENVARNFEELIQSDQTIQYTLTPESMRDIDSTRSVHNNSPAIGSKSRKSEDARSANAERTRSSSNAADLKRNHSVSRGGGLGSHPIQVGTKLTGPVPRAPGSAGAKSRANAPQARDARVTRESTIDFAEFIRTTGPPGGSNGPAPLRNLSGPISSAKNSIDSRRVSSTMNRPRLQAREAAVDGREDNSDLIDFIRRGPPSTASNPRIPRTVAPFRTTMDSDQMAGAVGGRAVDANLPNVRYSQASTNVTDMSIAPSIQSSINSQSALIKNKGSQYSGNHFDDDEMMMPKRKTRRVRDPYAIDFSDEEDEAEYAAPPKPAPKQEESLADFLKNYQPPPDNSASVPFDLSQSRPKKKVSAPSLMGRFTRNTSGSQTNGVNGMNGADVRSLSSRNGSGKAHVPIHVNMPAGYDKYGSKDAAAAAQSAGARRVPMKKFEPRDPVSSSRGTGTSDLAAFLRNSEPPPTMTPAFSAAAADDGGFPKFFTRRKKSAVA